MPSSPSYFAAFLRHPWNVMALLAAGCTATFASIPYGWEGLALVSVVALGIEALAALAIPDLPSFRAAVDRQRSAAARRERRERLFDELKNHGNSQGLASYRQMCARVEALYRTAAEPGAVLTRADVEKLDDLTVDYLGLFAVNLTLKQRKETATEEQLLKRIAALQTQLKNTALSAEEERQLRAALNEYTDAAHRARRLAIRRSALEATLTAMPDKMEEVYQLVLAAPYASDMGGKLEESLSRLRIAEEVAAEFADDERDDNWSAVGEIDPAAALADTRAAATATLAEIAVQQAERQAAQQAARRPARSVKH